MAPVRAPRFPFLDLMAARAAALLALVAGLVLSAFSAWHTSDRARLDTGVLFHGYGDNIADETVRRVQRVVLGLEGIRALAAVNGRLEQDEFRRYLANQNLPRDFPGIRGFGYIEPAGEHHLVVKYIEPPAGNEGALGFDAGADPARRAAAERAIDTGEGTLTSPIIPVQDPARKPGWLLFLAVYEGPGVPAGVDERRRRFKGLLYAPILPREMLAPVQQQADGNVEFQLVDAIAGAPGLYDSRSPRTLELQAQPGAQQPLLHDVRALVMGDRPYLLQLASTPSLDAGLGNQAARLVMVAGAALSLLFALAVWWLVRGRVHAEARRREVQAHLAGVIERTSSEAAQRERLIRLISDSMPALLSYWDRKLRCRLANRALAAVLGRSPEDLAGARLDELLPAGDLERLVPRMKAALQGEPQQFEWTHAGSEGPRTFMVYYVPDKDAAGVQGFFMFSLDITALNEAREAAQRASAAKTQFLSSMSHEIRTPLNAVLGMLALLRMTELDRRQEDYAAKAEAAARSLLSLLNDVLDFSKIEAGKMELDPRPFSFRTLLEELHVILSANLGGKPIALRMELDPAVPRWLRGDDMRLRQILINLGGNAVKFTQRGEVSVQVKLVRAFGGRAQVELSVADTGVGIAPDARQRIFSEFGQATAATTRRFGGTGLGLSICSRLAALMGGELGVESELGRGSRFHFRVALPITEDPGQLDTAPAPLLPHGGGAPPLRGLRLLLAEDNPINQQVARELLAAAGAEVQVVADGRAAVMAVASQPAFDAVLMDLQMPVQDGFEATRAIREVLQQRELPIIAMTANALDSDRERCRAAGMVDHVGKPFAPAALVATILRHARRTRGAAPQRAEPASTASEAPVLPTLDRAGAIAQLGDEGLYEQVTPLFLRDMAAALAQLPQLRATTPRADATRLFHTLKGTAAMMGAHRLAAAAAAAERVLLDDAGTLDDALLAELREALLDTQAAFGAHAATPPPRQVC